MKVQDIQKQIVKNSDGTSVWEINFQITIDKQISWENYKILSDYLFNTINKMEGINK